MIFISLYIYDDCGRGESFEAEEVLFVNNKVVLCLIPLYDDIVDTVLIYLRSGIVVSKELNYYYATNDKELARM